MASQVLILDNDHASRQMARVALEEHGYDVAFAINGTHALSKLSGNQVALIVMEVALEVDGLQTLRRIRRLVPHVPVVVTTDSPSADLQAACLQLGVQAWLPKPAPPERFIAAIDAALHKASELDRDAGKSRGA